jgi:hypothetical protein
MIYNYMKDNFDYVPDFKVDQLRKFITHSIFRHHGLSEAKKLIQEKETEINIDKTNLIICYINNLIEASIKIIDNGHSDHEFIEDCMKFAAFVFLTDYTDYANEIAKHDPTFSKGIWVIKFLWKAKSLRGCKHRIEALVTSTCNLLKSINKARLNRQILVFVQLFKGFVQNNDIPDVGSYIEAFSKDFEALFKIYSFTLNRTQIPGEMKAKIKMIKEERKKKLDEELKLREDSDVSEEENDMEEVEEEEKIEGVKRIEKENKDSKMQLIDENEHNVAYSKNVFVSLCINF